jgi:pyrimidine-nucleoside phosphorylase
MLTATAMRRLIARKRDGDAIERESLLAFVQAYMENVVDDAQAAAFLMACVLRGFDEAETLALTEGFVASGERLEISLGVPVLDKHSSGGVADTASLIVVPWVAACGIHVAKLSGRALGHTGGTLDKLEAVPGVRTNLDPAQFFAQLRDIGCVIAAQSDRFVPADKRIYALRDHTATVPSIGLIAASIVSKKIAGGASAVMYDIKAGNGAFMHDAAQARELAWLIVRLTRAFGKKAVALVTDMNEPLGSSIGTALEIIEARDFLAGTRRDPRLYDVCTALVRAMLHLAGHEQIDDAVTTALESGAAYARFERMLTAQGAKPGALDALVSAADQHAVTAMHAGFITEIDTVSLGEIARDIEENGNPTGGIRISARIGTYCRVGDLLAIMYGPCEKLSEVSAAFKFSATAPSVRPLIYEHILGHLD